jgi:hypothetical protein
MPTPRGGAEEGLNEANAEPVAESRTTSDPDPRTALPDGGETEAIMASCKGMVEEKETGKIPIGAGKDDVSSHSGPLVHPGLRPPSFTRS